MINLFIKGSLPVLKGPLGCNTDLLLYETRSRHLQRVNLLLPLSALEPRTLSLISAPRSNQLGD